MAQKSLIDAARSYVGVKWRHRGRSRHGIDCVGLIVLSCRDAGYHIDDQIGYSRTPWKFGLDRELQARFGEPVEGLQAGDIVSMRGPRQPEPGHVGIVATHGDRLTIIHSFNAAANSKVVEHGLDEYWLKRIHKIYRLPQ